MTERRNTHLIAVDPGNVSGIAEWSRDLSIMQVYEVPGGLTGLIDDWSWEGLDTVVCESFTVTPQTLKYTRQSSAQEIIGWLQGECYARSLKFVLQPPAAKRFGTVKKLKLFHAHRPSKGGHMQSAAGHLLSYLANVERDGYVRETLASQIS